MKTDPEEEHAAQERSISKQLQEHAGHPSAARKLYVAAGLGYYGRSSTALVEVEGSPIKGLAIIKGNGVLSECKPHDVEVWTLRRKGAMKRLQIGSSSAARILRYVQSQLPK